MNISNNTINSNISNTVYGKALPLTLFGNLDDLLSLLKRAPLPSQHETIHWRHVLRKRIAPLVHQINVPLRAQPHQLRTNLAVLRYRHS